MSLFNTFVISNTNVIITMVTNHMKKRKRSGERLRGKQSIDVSKIKG